MPTSCETFTNIPLAKRMFAATCFAGRRFEYKCRGGAADDVNGVIDYLVNARTCVEAYCIALYANIKIQYQPLSKLFAKRMFVAYI